jgi:hypothetical protein
MVALVAEQERLQTLVLLAVLATRHQHLRVKVMTVEAQLLMTSLLIVPEVEVEPLRRVETGRLVGAEMAVLELRLA